MCFAEKGTQGGGAKQTNDLVELVKARVKARRSDPNIYSIYDFARITSSTELISCTTQSKIQLKSKGERLPAGVSTTAGLLLRPRREED